MRRNALTTDNNGGSRTTETTTNLTLHIPVNQVRISHNPAAPGNRCIQEGTTTAPAPTDAVLPRNDTAMTLRLPDQFMPGLHCWFESSPHALRSEPPRDREGWVRSPSNPKSGCGERHVILG